MRRGAAAISAGSGMCARPGRAFVVLRHQRHGARAGGRVLYRRVRRRSSSASRFEMDAVDCRRSPCCRSHPARRGHPARSRIAAGGLVPHLRWWRILAAAGGLLGSLGACRRRRGLVVQPPCGCAPAARSAPPPGRRSPDQRAKSRRASSPADDAERALRRRIRVLDVWSWLRYSGPELCQRAGGRVSHTLEVALVRRNSAVAGRVRRHDRRGRVGSRDGAEMAGRPRTCLAVRRFCPPAVRRGQIGQDAG